MTLAEWADSRMTENSTSEAAFRRFLAFCKAHEKRKDDQPAEAWDAEFSAWKVPE